MKRIVFFVFSLLALSIVNAQEKEPVADNLWLTGIDVMTGKGVDIYHLPGKPLMNYISPESIECHQDGTATVAFKKYMTMQTKPRTFTWRMSLAAQKLISYAVKNHQWINIISSEQIKTDGQNEYAAITLEPYNFESEDSVAGTVPDKALAEWGKKGFRFSVGENGDTITSDLLPCLLAVKNGTAIIQTEGSSLFPTKEGRAYFTIKNISLPALEMLRYAVKNSAFLYFTYGKKTKVVARLRLDSNWNKSFIVGRDKTVK